MDFGYALGVLHHTPDPAAALDDCVRTLRPRAPFLVYVYYALEGRPRWYRVVWKTSDVIRRVVVRLPFRIQLATTRLLARMVYWPLARLALVLERAGFDVSAVPLSQYRGRSLYLMEADALDRFATPLEHRFRREQVVDLLRGAGLEDVVVGDDPPYWCAIGYKRSSGGARAGA